MGHIPSLYIIQGCELISAWEAKRQKFSKWKTLDMRNTLPEAQASLLEYFGQKDPAKIIKLRVRYKRETVAEVTNVAVR
jgi:hypothetical protein